MGRALLALRDRNVAIVGSGFASLHNFTIMMRLFQSHAAAASFKSKLGTWNQALSAAVLEENVDERCKKLAVWRDFPASYDAHPDGGADHFMPLLVCAGAAGDGKGASYKDDFAGADIWSYYWD